VDRFVIDGETWRIDHLVVDTSNWIGGRSILLSPTFAARRGVEVDGTARSPCGSSSANGAGRCLRPVLSRMLRSTAHIM
jgi:hypothetical protein